MIDVAAIDGFLSQHGQFCLLDWLIAEHKLAYGDYEAWRYGRVASLDGALNLKQEETEQLLEQTRVVCRQLKLLSEPQEFYSWDSENAVLLTVSGQNAWHSGLSARWFSPQDVPQMDLFMDNSATIAENHVLDALVNRQFVAAQRHLQKLAEFNPRHGKLGGYQDLLNYGLHMTANAGIDASSVDAEMAAVDQEVSPLAKELLGSKKRDYLSFAWRRLAENLTSVPFAPAKPQLHRSYALQQIPDWAELIRCLECEPALYRSPELMLRLADAYQHSRETPLYLLMWGMLLERFADLGEAWINQQPHLLVELWDSFLEFDDDWPVTTFLGYLLVRQPGLIHHLQDLPQQEQGGIKQVENQSAWQLVCARLAEQDEKTYRAALKIQSPALLRYYLNKRDWYASIRKVK